MPLTPINNYNYLDEFQQDLDEEIECNKWVIFTKIILIMLGLMIILFIKI